MPHDSLGLTQTAKDESFNTYLNGGEPSAEMPSSTGSILGLTESGHLDVDWRKLESKINPLTLILRLVVVAGLLAFLASAAHGFGEDPISESGCTSAKLEARAALPAVLKWQAEIVALAKESAATVAAMRNVSMYCSPAQQLRIARCTASKGLSCPIDYTKCDFGRSSLGCRAGFYDGFDASRGVAVQAERCPSGFYCPAGFTCLSPCLAPGSLCGVVSDGEVCSEAPRTFPSNSSLYCDCGERPVAVVNATSPTGTTLKCGGSGKLAKCPAGSFCPNPLTSDACPEGFFCSVGTAEPRKCPQVATCPAGAKEPSRFGHSLVLVLVLCFVLLFLRKGIKRLRDYRRNTREHSSGHARRKRQSGRNASMHADDAAAGKEATPGSAPAYRGGAFTIDIEVRDLGLTLKNSSKKAVLDGVCGTFSAGEVCAVMGPSGAGKTTFLSTLAGKASYGVRSGAIFVNGDASVPLSRFQKITGFVPQEDVMHRDLTVKETLVFQARLRLPASAGEVEVHDVVNDVIASLGLFDVRHMKIGDENIRGISGGQRKRVNIGMELVARPSLLFLDEPTSGLDSTSSREVVTALRTVATTKGINVLVVLHQPAYETFMLFHKVLLLGKGGRTVFLGPTEDAIGYFEPLGYTCPQRMNPADFFMGESAIVRWYLPVFPCCANTALPHSVLPPCCFRRRHHRGADSTLRRGLAEQAGFTSCSRGRAEAGGGGPAADKQAAI
jgi:ABC-type multidrug transport system ATPase subunit